jgi:hypothetical protein
LETTPLARFNNKQKKEPDESFPTLPTGRKTPSPTCLTQDGVAVAGDDTASRQGRFGKFFDRVVVDFFAGGFEFRLQV